jgi:hypothetical protein
MRCDVRLPRGWDAQDLFARGQSFSPHPLLRYALGGRRDFAFGIYGKADAARALLQDKYAGARAHMLVHLLCLVCRLFP